MDAPIAESPLQQILSRETALSARLDAEEDKAERDENKIAELRGKLATAREDRIAATAREDRIAQNAHEVRMAELIVEANTSAMQLAQVNNERLRIEVAAGVVDDVAQERRGFERRNISPDWGTFMSPRLHRVRVQSDISILNCLRNCF